MARTQMVWARAWVYFACATVFAACSSAEGEGESPCSAATDGPACAADAPAHTDGVKNAGETGVDCGGSLKADKPCPEGQACIDATDCAGACTNHVCGPVGPQDGKKNNGESDVDCGGPNAPKCEDGKACGSDGDCSTAYCKADSKICTPPRPDDHVKNGDETDVDCGGSVAPKCAVGQGCVAHTDCVDGCGETSHVCVKGKSCVKHNGGETCGATEAATGNCCETAPVANSTVTIDKYLVTAGRMRAMIERLNGDVRSFVQSLPTEKWQEAWNPYVPSNIDEANEMLGSYWNDAPNDADGGNSKRSCAPGSNTGRTYWTPRINGPDNTTDEDDDFSDFTQDQLDVKALNCVGWHLAAAFCAWDGGRLATTTDLHNAWTNGDTTSYPWGNDAPSAPDDRLNHLWNYGYPTVPNQRFAGDSALDIAWYISPPGRFPLGLNQNGVADLAGDLMHWNGDGPYVFSWTFSWEQHGTNYPMNWASQLFPGEPNGYYALGARCAHD